MRTAQIAAFGADSGGFRDGGVWPDNRYSQTGSRRIRDPGINRRERREGGRISRRSPLGLPQDGKTRCRRGRKGGRRGGGRRGGGTSSPEPFEFSYGLTDRWLFTT